MNDFIFLPEKYAGYPLSFAEAQQRFAFEPLPFLDVALMSASDQQERRHGAKVYVWHAVVTGALPAFVQSDDSGAWYRVPIGYWLDHRHGLEAAATRAMEEALDTHIQPREYLRTIPTDLLGRPIFVWRDDVDQLLARGPEQAKNMEALMNAVLERCGFGRASAGPDAPGTAAGLRPIQQPAVERWFREVRCPPFDGKSPPNWQSCWAAAQNHFAPHRVTRNILQSARREAAPLNWRVTGAHR